MADIALDTQGTPTTPSAGVVIIYADAGSKQLTAKNETGRLFTMPGIKNWNTIDQPIGATESYIDGSALAIPQHLMQAGTAFKWRLFITKTLGTGAWSFFVRVGTLATIAGSTARLTFAGPTQTGVADQAFVEITAILRNTGAAGVLAGGLVLNHSLNATGFTSGAGSPTVIPTPGAGFDTTVPNLIVGVSVAGGTAAAWTIVVVHAEALNV